MSFPQKREPAVSSIFLFQPHVYRKRSLRRLLFAAAFLLLVFGGGCGRSLEYDFPVHKTLFYAVTRQYGLVKDGKTEYNPRKINLDVKLLIKQNIGGRYSIKVVAAPSRERAARSLYKNLGENDIRIDNKGNIEEIYGMGIPVELRLVIPELPSGRLSKGDKWKRVISNDYMQKSVDLDLTMEYVGNARVLKRNCAHIHGTAEYNVKDHINNPDRDMYLNLYLELHYKEDIYFDSARGYLLKMVTTDTRLRRFTDTYTGKSREIVDTRRTVSELVRIE